MDSTINLIKVDEDYIRKSPHKFSWFEISANKNLSESFIREFENKVCWAAISQHQKLSEDFIRDFKDKVDWIEISYSQTLSEDFIRDNQDEVHWAMISEYQTLSEPFIKEFRHKLNLFLVLCHQKLTYEFKNELKKYLEEQLLSKEEQQIFSGFIMINNLDDLKKYSAILNQKVTNSNEIKITFNYPLSRDVIIKFKNNCQDVMEPVTFLDLFYFIRRGYIRLYREEEEAHSVDMNSVSNPYHRPNTNGPYGIYGHDWTNLSIESIYKKGDVFTLSMGS